MEDLLLAIQPHCGRSMHKKRVGAELKVRLFLYDNNNKIFNLLTWFKTLISADHLPALVLIFLFNINVDKMGIEQKPTGFL